MKKLLLFVVAAVAVWLVFRDSRPQRIVKATEQIVKMFELPAFSKEETNDILQKLQVLDKKDPKLSKQLDSILQECKKETSCGQATFCLLGKLTPTSFSSEERAEVNALLKEHFPTEH